jgi:hypothetical protein
MCQVCMTNLDCKLCVEAVFLLKSLLAGCRIVTAHYHQHTEFPSRLDVNSICTLAMSLAADVQWRAGGACVLGGATRPQSAAAAQWCVKGCTVLGGATCLRLLLQPPLLGAGGAVALGWLKGLRVVSVACSRSAGGDSRASRASAGPCAAAARRVRRRISPPTGRPALTLCSDSEGCCCCVCEAAVVGPSLWLCSRRHSWALAAAAQGRAKNAVC